MEEPVPSPMPTADPLPPPVPKSEPAIPALPHKPKSETPPLPYSKNRSTSLGGKWIMLTAVLILVGAVASIGYFARDEIQSMIADLQGSFETDVDPLDVNDNEEAIVEANPKADLPELLPKVEKNLDNIVVEGSSGQTKLIPSNESSNVSLQPDRQASQPDNAAVSKGLHSSETDQNSVIKPNIPPTLRVQPSHDRQVADWIIRKGGTLSIVQESNETAIHANGRLPDESFAITSINLERKNIDDDDLHQLLQLKRLRSVNLMWTQVTDGAFRTLSQVESLEEINVAATSINGSGFKFLEDSKNLRVLLCGGCQSITDGSLSFLANVPNLKTLGLIDTRISDDALKHVGMIRSLETLNLAGIGFTLKISDVGLKHLHGLKNLKSLNVEKTNITTSGVRLFRQAVPNCTVRL